MPWWASIKEAWQSLVILSMKKNNLEKISCGGGDFHNRMKTILKEHSY